VVIGKDGRRQVFGPTLGGSYGGLDRKIALFGRGSFDEVFRYGQNQELLGREVGRVGVHGPGRVRIELDDAESFADVQARSSFVPSSVRGVAHLPKGTPGPVDLAVAVNGVIRGVVRTWDVGGTARWSALVPETAFVAGSNRVEVFVVSADEEGHAGLERTTGGPGAPSPAYALAGPRRRGETLVTPDGRAVALVPKAVRGCLDVVNLENRCVGFAGWAADVANAEIPEAVVVLADGKFFHAGRVNACRPDVRDVYGKPALVDSGFSFAFPLERFQGLGNPEVRLFAVAKTGVASELSYPDWYKKQSCRPFQRR
jgi:hypothetical protein